MHPIKVKSFATEVPCIRIPNQFKNRKAKSSKLTQKYCMVNIASSFLGPLQDFPNQFKNRKAKSKLTQKYCMVNIEQAVFQG